LEDKAMRKIILSVFIHCLILFLPLATMAVEPSLTVFTVYQENYTILKNNKANITLSFSTEKPLEGKLLIPLAINNIQNAEVSTSDENIQVSLVTINNNTYLEINPDVTIGNEINTLTINLKIEDFIMGKGFFFRKKIAMIPLISNYPGNSKSNIFIDSYISVISIPGNYNLDNLDIGDVESDYKIYFDKSGLSDHDLKLQISAENLNLHAINHEAIQLSKSFNPIILMVLIIALLALYLVYFSSLIKYEEPVQSTASRY
jgi:hypothetical protein